MPDPSGSTVGPAGAEAAEAWGLKAVGPDVAEAAGASPRGDEVNGAVGPNFAEAAGPWGAEVDGCVV